MYSNNLKEVLSVNDINLENIINWYIYKYKNFLSVDEIVKVKDGFYSNSINYKSSFSDSQIELLWWYYTYFNDTLWCNSRKIKDYFKYVKDNEHIRKNIYWFIEEKIFNILRNLSWLNVEVKKDFSPFVIQLFPLNKHVSKKWWVAHYDLEWLTSDTILDKIRNTDEHFDFQINPFDCVNEVFTALVMIQAPEQWWETFFWDRKFDNTDYSESFEWYNRIKVKYQDWDLVIFSGFHLHWINAFSWNKDRITLLWHFILKDNKVIVWF